MWHVTPRLASRLPVAFRVETRPLVTGAIRRQWRTLCVQREESISRGLVFIRPICGFNKLQFSVCESSATLSIDRIHYEVTATIQSGIIPLPAQDSAAHPPSAQCVLGAVGGNCLAGSRCQSGPRNQAPGRRLKLFPRSAASNVSSGPTSLAST